MNKKLIAVAVAGAFAAPAIALAQTSTVNIYGKVNVEYGYADQGGGRPDTDIFQVPGGSSVGFRGEEKLGGGLSAWFQCESSADIRGLNQDGFCSRNSAMGFKGGWGNLHFGRWDTPFKRAINAGNVGYANGTGLLGGTFLMTGSATGTVAPSNRNVWRRREASLIYYESPVFSGFQVLGAFNAGNAATSAINTTTAAKPRVASLGGIYKNGPLSIGLGYERHSEFAGVGGANDDRGWAVSAAYTFMGKIKVGAAYIDTRYETSGATELKKKNWTVGVDWKIAGPHSLEGFYTRAGDSKGSGAGIGGGNGPLAAPGPDTGARQWEVVYNYAFSKRTRMGFGYVRVDNDANSSYTLGGLGALIPVGDNQSAFVMRGSHTF